MPSSEIMIMDSWSGGLINASEAGEGGVDITSLMGIMVMVMMMGMITPMMEEGEV